MAKLPAIFSTEGKQELGSFEAFPRGEYVAQIINSEMKKTNAGDGEYLELQFQVLEGEYRGRSVWSRLNLVNKNEVAVDIAYQHLTSICKAIDIVVLGEDSAPLHGKPMVIKVTVKPADAQYEASNEVKGYSKYTGAKPEPVAVQSGSSTPSVEGASAAAVAATSGKKPWEK